MVVDKSFNKINFYAQPLEGLEYDGCAFNNCNFSKTNLSNISFIDCTFLNCDFSNAQLNNTGFQEVVFVSSKLIGLRFDTCKLFLLQFTFENCILNYSSFYGLKIPNTQFGASSLIEVDFTEVDARRADFSSCNLTAAVFENSILEGADFRMAENFAINPESNYIQKAKFTKDDLLGLLWQYNLDLE